MVDKGRTPPRHAAALAALAAAALAAGCAGPGKSYGCDADAGPCSSPGNPDGGHPDLPPFLGTPRTVAKGGQHDAFGDLAKFAGNVYAVFRRAAYRGYDGAAKVVVARSTDKGRTWAEIASFGTPGFDARDPKLTVFRDKLVLSATAWDVSNPTLNRTAITFAVSSDGVTFDKVDPPSLPQPVGLSAWRPRVIDDAFFIPVWVADELKKHPELNRVSLLRSSDGQTFGAASVLPLGGGASEPELLVQSGGRVLLTAPESSALGNRERQSFCRSTVSAGTFADWVCFYVNGPRIENPALYEWKDFILLSGRHDVGEGRRRTGLWQVLEDERSLSLIAELDTAADTGALGFISLDDGTALLAYHSTAKSDPVVVALGHEPTEVEAIRMALPTEVLAVELSLLSAPIGK